MARSPLTLAASVTSAVPRVGVVAAGALTEGSSGRYDSALAHLDDGRRVVVRAPADPSGAPELAAQARALRALTPGVRALLPFRAPELLGETSLGDARAIVVDFLPGYRVDPAHLPPGRGAATSVGAALAALHALPLSIVRAEGLPARTPAQVRAEVESLVDRAAPDIPAALTVRWRRALDSDRLWRFEPAVVIGASGAASCLFEDVDDEPHVTGLLDWHELSVGDPALDLLWLASAPEAADDVFESYAAHCERAPDSLIRERARLYAELEFARWLVHGRESDRADIVEDATALLESLAGSVGGLDVSPDAHVDVEDAIALIGSLPEGAAGASNTAMQTDTYDPSELSLWLDSASADESTQPIDPLDPPADGSAIGGAAGADEADRAATGPIDLESARREREDDHDDAAARDAERASRAAFQRWTSSGSE